MSYDYVTTTIELNEPFWGAGVKFDWDGDAVGLGVNEVALKGYGELIIKVKKYGTYRVDKVFAREMVDRYNAYQTRRGTRLAIIPRKICDVLETYAK